MTAPQFLTDAGMDERTADRLADLLDGETLDRLQSVLRSTPAADVLYNLACTPVHDLAVLLQVPERSAGVVRGLLATPFFPGRVTP